MFWLNVVYIFILYNTIIILYKKIIKNGKKKRCFLFSYAYVTSLHV